MSNRVLEEMISSLKQQRDELALQMHLGRAEAKEEWEKVKDKLDKLMADYEPFQQAAKETSDNVMAGMKLVADEVMAGFERVRKLL